MTEWADTYRYLSPESSAEPGKWHTYKTPYMKEIMNAISDINVQKVVFMSAAQLSKTEGAVLNTIGYYMHYEPSPIMVMQPTIQMAESFSKDRLAPMIRTTPVLKNKVNDKNRSAGNTILHKVFPGGHVTMVGANSPSSLASRPIRILLADEVDRYPITAGNEGDPLLLAEKRLATFWNKKEVCVSTPTVKGISRIELEYEHSTKEIWTVPCPECGEYQEIKWSDIVFDRENLDEIMCVCEKCGTASNEYRWKEQFINGKFVAGFPKRKVRGFHLNSLASNFISWREIVEKFLKANEESKKGNIELLKSWTNTEMGETWEEDGEQMDEEILYNRRELYNCEVPEDVLILTAGVDVQENRFEIEVVGWGEDRESWGIKFASVYGDTEQPQSWKMLEEYLSQTFTRADGLKMNIACTCIDSGFRATKVYQFCKSRVAKRFFAIKGKGGADQPYFSRPSFNNAYKCPLFIIGVDTGKSLLLSRLKIEKGDNSGAPGYCHFPEDMGAGYTMEYFKGLTSEKLILKYKKGRPVYEWQIIDYNHKRNEPLDCRNYATAALEILNPILKKSDKNTQKPKKTGRRKKSGGII